MSLHIWSTCILTLDKVADVLAVTEDLAAGFEVCEVLASSFEVLVDETGTTFLASVLTVTFEETIVSTLLFSFSLMTFTVSFFSSTLLTGSLEGSEVEVGLNNSSKESSEFSEN